MSTNDHLRVETILKESQSRFLAIFEQSPISMILFSPQGYVRGANQAFEQFFGLEPEELITSNFNILGHESIQDPTLFITINKGFQDRFVELGQTILFTHDGIRVVSRERAWLSCSIHPIKDSLGEIIEVVMMHQDISGQKETENSLLMLNHELETVLKKRTAKLKKLDQELIRAKIHEDTAIRNRDEYFAKMSHELRTPLTAIKEASSMLHQGIFQDKPRQQKELLSIVKDECNRLIRSVNRVLDFSKMETGIKKYSFERASLNNVISSSVFKLNPIAQKKEIHLEFSPKCCIPQVKIDPEKIGKVLGNLIGNALKFTPTGGRINIKSTLIPDGSCVQVSIADTGCGIDSNYLERIFDMFERIKHKSYGVKGSGLGLFIANTIISDHKGKIWAESELGKGSTFFFTLPVDIKEP